MVCVLALVVFLSAVPAIGDGKNVEIVVNQALLDSGDITASLNTYVDDLHRDGWNPTRARTQTIFRRQVFTVFLRSAMSVYGSAFCFHPPEGKLQGEGASQLS